MGWKLRTCKAKPVEFIAFICAQKPLFPPLSYVANSKTDCLL